MIAELVSARLGHTPIELPERVVAIDAASWYACALGETGSVFCWDGGTGFGPGFLPRRRGAGTERDPLRIDLPPVQALALDFEAACFIADGRALCVDATNRPRFSSPHARAISLGGGGRCVASDDEVTCSTDQRATHHPLRATQIAGDVNTACALADNRVYCWHGGAAAHAIDVADASAIAVGDFEACALTRAGALYCWSWTP